MSCVCRCANSVPTKLRETLAERGREIRRPSCHCLTELPNKPFGSSTHLAHEAQSEGESAQPSGRNVVETTCWSPEVNPAPNSHNLQLSSGSCQTMLSRIRCPSRSIHRSLIQQVDTKMTTKRHPPTVVTATSPIDGRGDVTFAPQDGQTSFTLDP